MTISTKQYTRKNGSIGGKIQRMIDRKNESVADFKTRIARYMREKETGKRYSIIGAAPASPELLR